MEQRSSKSTVEIRDDGPKGPMIVGYGAVFNRDSADLGFVEQVDPNAFAKTLQEADVRGLVNHDANWLIGRTKAGTMRLSTDSVGLRYEIDVNPEDPDGQRAIAKVRRGDLDGSSFSFQTVRDEWNWQTTPPQRRLLEVGLIDCGPVSFPAYADATASVRSALGPIASKVGKPVDELVAALRSGEIRSLLGGTMTDDLVPEPTEERAGKVLSSKNMASLQAVHDSLSATLAGIRDLMNTAVGETPADSEIAPPLGDQGADERDDGTDAEPDDDPDDPMMGQTPYRSLQALQVELRQREQAVLEAA